MSKRELILNTVDDLVGELLYYGRKEDEDLPRGEIEKSIAAGDISREEIIAFFTEKFNKSLDA